MRRLLLACALWAAALVGCGAPTGNNADSKDTGPALEVNPKGPPPMKGPGQGLPPNMKKS